MKKTFRKRYISLLLLLAILFTPFSMINFDLYALENESNTVLTEEEELKLFNEYCQTLSLEELDTLITSIRMDNIDNDIITTYSNNDNVIALKKAWLAAASAAKVAGLDCAGTLLEYSVFATNYYENSGGRFTTKIANSRTFNNVMNKATSAGYSPYRSSMQFTASENLDLFLSIHRCSITVSRSGSSHIASVFDIYDFHQDNGNQLLGGLSLNNVGYLMQNAGVLTPISFNIQITV